MKRILMLVYALVLLGVALLALIGFLATFEPSEFNVIPWRVGYAAFGLWTLMSAVWLVVRGFRSA